MKLNNEMIDKIQEGLEQVEVIKNLNFDSSASEAVARLIVLHRDVLLVAQHIHAQIIIDESEVKYGEREGTQQEVL